MNNCLKLLLIIGLLVQSGKAIAQGKPINYPGMLEIKSAVVDKDKIYLVGCAPQIETLSSNPVVVCTNLVGDTLWTKEFRNFDYGGNFEKVILADHMLYIAGSIKESKYSSQNVVFKVSDTGELVGGRVFKDKEITTISWNGEQLYLAGVNMLYDDPGSFIYRCDRDFENGNLLTFWKDAKGNSAGNGREIQFLKSSIWLSGTCETETKDGYAIIRFDENLKELSSFSRKKEGDSRCLKMMVDKSNAVWTCGHLNPERGVHFLYVVRFNEKGDTIYSYKHFMGARSFEVTNLLETASGEVLVVTKINYVAQLIRFRKGKFYKIEPLENLGDILPVQLVEVKSGEIRLLAMELFGRGYGKSTFFPIILSN
ncbi:MAG: hypothetical protein ACO1N0_10425 [Fluviicola sp.]